MTSMKKWIGLAAVALAVVVVGGAVLPDAGTDGYADRAEASEVALPDDLDATIASLEGKAAEREDAATFSALGHAYLEKARGTADPGWYTKADAALERARTIDSNDPDAALGEAILAGARHEFADSARWARRATELDPYDALAHGVAGDALLQLGREKAAVAEFQKMMDLKPTFGAWARVAYLAEVRGDAQGALYAMRQALRSTLSGTEDAAWVRYQIAELHAGAQDLERAAVEYERAAAEAPGYYLPREGLGHLAFTRGDIDEAIEHISAVVEAVPLPDYVISLGDLLALKGDNAGAQDQYARAIELQRRFHAAGVSADTEEAIFYANDRRDPERALQISMRLMKDRHRNAEVQATYAWALRAAGQSRRAAHHVAIALRSTRDPQTLYFAGMIHSDLGDASRAKALLNEALDADPYFSFRYPTLANEELERLARAKDKLCNQAFH